MDSQDNMKEAFSLMSDLLTEEDEQATPYDILLTIIDTFPFYVMLVDSDHTILLVNKAIRDKYDVEPEEIIGAYCPRAIHGVDHFPGCPLEESLQKGHSVKKELFDEQNACWYDSEIYPTPLRTADGKKIFLHNVTDITKRKHAEEERDHLLDKYVTGIERLKALRKIDRGIIGSFDLEISLKVIVDRAVEQLEVDAAALLLFEEDLQVLKFAQGAGFHTDALRYTDLRLGQSYAGEAALERQKRFIPRLNYETTGFLRAPSFKKEGFVSYYCIPLLAKGKLMGVLEIFNRTPMDPDRDWEDFLDAISNQAAIAIDSMVTFNDLQRANLELTNAYDATIEGWALALEMKDVETEGHSGRVVELTLKVAEEMGIAQEKLPHIRRGALLHDIGKMGIPDGILQKPGPLNEEEWTIMRLHPVYAYKMLKRIDFLRPALNIPRYHHERWNGSGYPSGLEGESIPLPARIFAVVDVWDALRSDRPYREAWTDKKALGHIKEHSGKLFDPRVVKHFLQIIGE